MAVHDIVPDSIVPGTHAWAETLAANARRYAGFTEKDVRPLVERYRKLVEHEAWEILLTEEPRTKERFCAEVLGYTSEFLDVMDQGVRVLETAGHSGAITAKQAQTALSEHRGRTVTERNSRGGGPTSTITQRSTSDYFVSRLKRDDPELAERVIQGELTPNAAAREKGWRKPRIVLSSPERVAESLRKYMSADDIAKLIAVLLGQKQGD